MLWSATIGIIVIVRLAATGDPAAVVYAAAVLFAIGLLAVGAFCLRSRRRGEQTRRWQRLSAAFLSLMLLGAVSWGTWLSFTAP